MADGVPCECGAVVKNLTTHRKTDKHANAMLDLALAAEDRALAAAAAAAAAAPKTCECGAVVLNLETHRTTRKHADAMEEIALAAIMAGANLADDEEPSAAAGGGAAAAAAAGGGGVRTLTETELAFLCAHYRNKRPLQSQKELFVREGKPAGYQDWLTKRERSSDPRNAASK